MDMNIITISKEHPDIAVWEIKELLKIKNLNQIDRYILTASLNKKLLDRLGYSKQAFKVIFSCKPKEIINRIKEYKLNNLIKKSYKIKHYNIKKEIQEEINSAVWHKLKNPKVKMKNPFHELGFIKLNQKIYFCMKIWENTEDFDSRLPHKRIGLRPISLKPRFARALVNLSGCRKGTIVDPMTGTSGILIEALLCGLKAEGYDINEIFLRISDLNLKKYEGNYSLQVKNFFALRKKINYIVSDLPYGKNTKSLDMDFYKKVAEKLKQILVKRAIIIFPSTCFPEKLITQANLKLIKKFTIFIHNSMSRIVCIIENPNHKKLNKLNNK